jgi:hypothetical protein
VVLLAVSSVRAGAAPTTGRHTTEDNNYPPDPSPPHSPPAHLPRARGELHAGAPRPAAAVARLPVCRLRVQQQHGRGRHHQQARLGPGRAGALQGGKSRCMGARADRTGVVWRPAVVQCGREGSHRRGGAHAPWPGRPSCAGGARAPRPACPGGRSPRKPGGGAEGHRGDVQRGGHILQLEHVPPADGWGWGPGRSVTAAEPRLKAGPLTAPPRVTGRGTASRGAVGAWRALPNRRLARPAEPRVRARLRSSKLAVAVFRRCMVPLQGRGATSSKKPGPAWLTPGSIRGSQAPIADF